MVCRTLRTKLAGPPGQVEACSTKQGGLSKIEQGRSGLLLPQLQGAGCDTKDDVGVSKDI